MSVEKLSHWLTLVANLGVLAGIIFLAIELQQNNRLLESEARANRLENRLATNNYILTIPELRLAWIKNSNREPLNQEEILLLDRMGAIQMRQWEHAVVDFTEGLLDRRDIPIDNWRDQWHSEEAGEWIRDYWNSGGENRFRPEFVQFMQENILN